MPFNGKETLLDVSVSSLAASFGTGNIIVATSANPADDRIEAAAVKHGVRVFRGEEQNVLRRFIAAAEKYELKNIIRVCADNPLIQPEYISALISESGKVPADYISYALSDGTPSIKTHYGFFAEFVTLHALKRVASLTSENLYTEHVTNYIYAHPDHFKIHFIPVPSEIEARKDIRLTVDTQLDFETCAVIYGELRKRNKKAEVSEILSIIDGNSYLQKIMHDEIRRNKK